MNWDRAAQISERTAGALCLLVVAGSAAFFTWDAHQTQLEARASIAAGTGTLTSLNGTLEFVNRPCATMVKGKLLPDGPLCELDEMIHDVRKIATASGRQVQQTGDLITATTTDLDRVATTLQATAGAVTGTAQAATGSLAALQVDLARLQAPIDASQGLLAHATGTVDDLDAMLKANATELHSTLVGVDGIANNTAGITGSVNLMAAHLEKTVDAKQALWRTLVPGAEQAGKIYACIVYHDCVN